MSLRHPLSLVRECSVDVLDIRVSDRGNTTGTGQSGKRWKGTDMVAGQRLILLLGFNYNKRGERKISILTNLK